MKRVFVAGALLACAFGFAATGASAVTVEHYGKVFGTHVCGPVSGLTARCHAIVVTDAKGVPIRSNTPPISGLTPKDLREAYKITEQGSPSTIIAIVDGYGYPNAEADLATYRAQWGLPPCTTDNGCFKKLNQHGGTSYPAFNAGWATEQAIDIQMASAMCPSCTIYLIEGFTANFRDLGQAEDTAASLGAHVISNSYGGSEGTGVRHLSKFYDHPGIAITASTGDSGFAAGPQAPASMPTVIAVGGTFLFHDKSYARHWGETVWTGAGGGCSNYFPKPTWQTDWRCPRRMEADVAADANPESGVAVYVPTSATQSSWAVYGGTSVAAPIVGGIFGLNGGSVNAASTIYSAGPKELYDVKHGYNGTCKPKYYCNAKRGYDGPTGMGSPRGIAAFGSN